MTFETLEKLVGEDWALFLKEYMCPDPVTGKAPFDEIQAQVKDMYKGGQYKVFPSQGQIFRAFKETPFDSLRVIVLGMDPYAREGFANGIAFSTNAKEYKEIPPALKLIYDAVEKDAYHGVDPRKTLRNGTLGRPDDSGVVHKTWMQQGVLMLNSALTVQEKVPGSHMKLWNPFTTWFISNIWRIKRQLIFCGWGADAREILVHRPTKNPGPDMMDTGTGVNLFAGFVLTHEHPVNAGRDNREWLCTHFSHINNIIKINHLGEPIEW